MYSKWVEHHFMCDGCANGIRYITTPYKMAKADLIKHKWKIKGNSCICPVCLNIPIDREYRKELTNNESISI